MLTRGANVGAGAAATSSVNQLKYQHHHHRRRHHQQQHFAQQISIRTMVNDDKVQN